MTQTVLIINAAATWFMVGLIWIIQIVHYPLMAKVGNDAAIPYAHDHQRRITFIVAPVMLIEAAAAITLALMRPSALSLIAVIALVLIWASTAVLQIPQHAKLAQGSNPEAVRKLVASNWIRTALWSLRGVFAALLLAAS